MESASEPASEVAWRPDAPATAYLLGRGQIEQVVAERIVALGELFVAEIRNLPGYDR